MLNKHKMFQFQHDNIYINRRKTAQILNIVKKKFVLLSNTQTNFMIILLGIETRTTSSNILLCKFIKIN